MTKERINALRQSTDPLCKEYHELLDLAEERLECKPRSLMNLGRLHTERWQWAERRGGEWHDCWKTKLEAQP